jgi:hypothetical protein
LFAIAVELGWAILERHGHSMALGDPHAFDATVAYPHVDLRIAPRTGTATLDVAVKGDVLVVSVHHAAPRLRVDVTREQRDDGETRDTRVRRRVWRELELIDSPGLAGARSDAQRRGELIEDAMIVDDHQKIPAALRTCLDCGETACRSRVTIP